jgi:hypothetical protein
MLCVETVVFVSNNVVHQMVPNIEIQMLVNQHPLAWVRSRKWFTTYIPKPKDGEFHLVNVHVPKYQNFAHTTVQY